MVRRTFVALSLVYATASTAMALMAAFAVGEWPSVRDRVLVVLATLGGAVLIAAGLRVSSRRQSLGAIFVVVGTLPLAFGFWWTIVVPVIAAAVVIAAAALLVEARSSERGASVGRAG